MPFPEGADKNAPPTELDRLRVAMAVEVARDIADADGILDVGEVELLSRMFPTPWMKRCGFLDDENRLTADVESWYSRARRELPTRLHIDQKLEMITLFHRMCMADEEMHELEFELLTDVARRLHIPRDRFKAHLQRLERPDSAVPPARRYQG